MMELMQYPLHSQNDLQRRIQYLLFVCRSILGSGEQIRNLRILIRTDGGDFANTNQAPLQSVE